MYDPQLESLINATLVDGVLTEKEKQVLFKKAQALGVDLDELEVVLDARLVELKKAEKAKAEKSAPKSNKLGDVRKCPACGAIVQQYQGLCPECGYAFEGVSANSTMRALAAKIDEISQRYDNKNFHSGTIEDANDVWEHNKKKHQAIANAIKTSPIPTTKADLFEFITSSQAAMMDSSNYKVVSDAYLSKYREAVIKAKALFIKDSLFAQLISDQVNVEKEYKQKKHRGYGMKPSIKFGMILFSSIIGLFLIMIMVF